MTAASGTDAACSKVTVAGDTAPRGPAAALAPVRAAALTGWPAEPVSLPCDHAGLLLLAPVMTEAGLHELISGSGYPATSRLSA